MTTTKTTPGPWKWEPETKTIRSQKENYWLATMNSFDGAVNNEANAKLIASAPVMLEALQCIVDAYGDACECIDNTKHCPYCVARAAITTATL